MNNAVRTKEGHLYRIEDGQLYEYVKHGDQLLRSDNPLLHQCIGQLVLELSYEETNP